MIIIVGAGASQAQIENIRKRVEAQGLKTDLSMGQDSGVIGCVGDVSQLDTDMVSMMPGVERVMKVSEPFKRANRKFHPEDTIVQVGSDVRIGDGSVCTMAGPCSVESEEQILQLAKDVKASGAKILRGGAYKPRTSPYAFQGMEEEGLRLLALAREATGLPVVTEIIDPRHVERFAETVDIFQIGARNMQNFQLLKEVGGCDKPILLKRGLANTIEEWLMSAEYILSRGNHNVILCERGIRTMEPYTRNTLDLSAVVAVKKRSHLPVIVDPSHATGHSWMVDKLACAAVAAGADGLMIEVHNDPPHALSDGPQSLTPEQFGKVMGHVKKYEALRREV